MERFIELIHMKSLSSFSGWELVASISASLNTTSASSSSSTPAFMRLLFEEEEEDDDDEALFLASRFVSNFL